MTLGRWPVITLSFETPFFSGVSVADQQNVDTFLRGVWSMNCFRGSHPHLNGHVYSYTALPTDGEKKP